MPRTLLSIVCALFALIGFASIGNAAPAATTAQGATPAEGTIRLAQRYYYDPYYNPRRYRYRNYRNPRRPVRRARPRRAAKPVPVAPWKVNEANKDPVMLIVSLPSQKMSVYKGTELVTTSRVSSGKPGYSTPAGVFSILEKKRRHYSNLYGGAAMPNMQRLTWSGVALHASGSVPGYPASHGCVRLPPSFARRLFPFTVKGGHVIVTNEDVTPQEFTHVSLFQPLGPEPVKEPEPVAAAAPETTQSTGSAEDTEQEPGWLDWMTGSATAKPSGEKKVAEVKPENAPETATDASKTIAPAPAKQAAITEQADTSGATAVQYGAGAAAPPEEDALTTGTVNKPEDAAEPETAAKTPPVSTSPIRVLITRRTGRAQMLEIQELLFDLGHEPGDIDGFMGRDTANAIKRFQKFEGMTVNGLMSDDLLGQLHKAAGMSEVKEGHIYVRRDYKDLFDAPVLIRNPEVPLGTHHLTVMHFDESATQARWLALSLKDRTRRARRSSRRARAGREETPAPAPEAANLSEALDRIAIPEDIKIRISRLLRPGSSVAISDHGLGPETGKGTDFIVLTH
jgi:lipoprotein-anchoring transpeptidase ErfK/SrfK